MIHLRPDDISPEPAASQAAAGRLAAATHHQPPGDDVAAALCSPGLSDVLAVRIGQIERHGHTRAADDAVPMWQWRNMLGQGLEGAIAIRTGLPLGMARKRLVHLAAFILAMIDRIDRERPPSSSEAIGQKGENPQ